MLKKIEKTHLELIKNNKTNLLDYINNRFLNDKKLIHYIGRESNTQAMKDNHENHLAFMIVVFSLNNHEILHNTLKWVYKAYHSQGFSYDYFLYELKIWKMAYREYLPSDSTEDILNIYDYMIECHEFNIQESRKISHEDYLVHLSPEVWEFLNTVLAGNHRKASELTTAYLKKNPDIKNFYLNLITPVMYSVGLLWEEGIINPAKEHLATAIITNILSSLYNLLDFPEATKGKMVVSSTANEFHQIGALMTASFFEFNGWEVNFLGSNTPVKDLVNLLKEVQADALGISVTMICNIEGVIETIETIRKDPLLSDLKIFVGGSLFSTLPEAADLLDADYVASTIEDALDFINENQ